AGGLKNTGEEGQRLAAPARFPTAKRNQRSKRSSRRSRKSHRLITGVLEYWSHGVLVNPLLHYSTTPLLPIPRHESYQPPNRSQAASQTQQRHSLPELLPRKDYHHRAHRHSSEKKLGLKANQPQRQRRRLSGPQGSRPAAHQ